MTPNALAVLVGWRQPKAIRAAVAGDPDGVGLDVPPPDLWYIRAQTSIL